MNASHGSQHGTAIGISAAGQGRPAPCRARCSPAHGAAIASPLLIASKSGKRRGRRRFAGFFRRTPAILLLAFSTVAASFADQNYTGWLDANGLPADASGMGAIAANPSCDGLPNLLKYALGLNAFEPGYAGRYVCGAIKDGAASYFAVTYVRPSPAPIGVSTSVELSSDLASWSTGAIEVQNTASNGLQTVVARDTEPLDTAPLRRFMRLRVSVTAAVPANSQAPQITGIARVGQILSVSPGIWSGGTDAPSYGYQWMRDGSEISGATAASYFLTAADVGAMLAVRVTARNIAGSTPAVAADAGPVAPALPQLQVRPDGFTANLSFADLLPGGTYDLSPDSAPKVVLTVSSPGFDDTGSATTLTRQIVGTVPLRKPYPNENSHTETAIAGGVQVTVALSDRIHSGDTVTQCVLLPGAYTSGGTPSPAATLAASAGSASNMSALPYQKPIANWLAFPRERAAAGADSFDLELLAFHRFPRQGRQVACVEFIATDEHAHSVSVKTSAMVQSSRVTTGNPIAVYRNSIPLATLTQGDHITVRAKIYPFLGDSSGMFDSDPSADGVSAAVPSGFANYIFLNDKTGGYGTVYAYVGPTGSDASGVASDVAATASASPFLTIYAAAAAIKSKNNTLHAHNDLGGGVVRLLAGTYAGFGATSLNALGAGRTWLTIEAAPGEGVSTVTFTTGTKKNPGNWVKFKNLAITPSSTAYPDDIVLDGVLDGAFDGPPVLYGAYEGVRIHGLNAAHPIIYEVGLRYFIGCDMKDLGKSLNNYYGATREHTPLLAGCTLAHSTQVASGGLQTPTWTNVGNILSKGVYFTDVLGTAGTGAGTTRVVAPKGAILAFNSEFGAVTTSSFGFKQAILAGGGLAIVQNVFEMITNNASPCFNMAGDGGMMALDNILVQHMTVVGARTNFLYNDAGTQAVPKNGSLMYSLLRQYNCKTDTFNNPTEGPNGVRTGNWEPHHGVGFVGNMYQAPANNGPSYPYTSPTSWNGMYLGQNTKVAGSASFINDLSLTGGNTGGGNYRLGASSDARNRVPAGFAALPFDLDGTPRHNDGSGAAGAYEYVD